MNWGDRCPFLAADGLNEKKQTKKKNNTIELIANYIHKPT